LVSNVGEGARIPIPRCARVWVDARTSVREGGIGFCSCASRRAPWTLISRFRGIIRGGCVISFLVISCSTRRGTYTFRPAHLRAPSRHAKRRGCRFFRADGTILIVSQRNVLATARFWLDRFLEIGRSVGKEKWIDRGDRSTFQSTSKASCLTSKCLIRNIFALPSLKYRP